MSAIDSATAEESVADRPSARTRPFVDSVLPVLFAVACGLAVRLPEVVHAAFPLGDGGLFYSAIHAILRAHFSYPTSTGYDGIPFTYPPLALFFAAATSQLFSLRVVTALRFLPLAATTASIVPFSVLAARLLRSRTAFVVAVVVFPLLPRTSLTLISGGGLTRSFGLFFALSALASAAQMHVDPQWRWRLAAGAFSGLTVLSHPEMTWFLVISLAILLGFRAKSVTGAVSTLITGVIAVIVSAPWWILVTQRFGIGPFLAAAHTGGSMAGNILTTVIPFNITDEAFFPVFAMVALIGVAWTLREREWFLPVWMVALMVLDTRSFETDAVVILALFIGLAVSEIILPFASLDATTRCAVISDERACRPSRSSVFRPLPILLCVGITYAAICTYAGLVHFDAPLAATQRTAMSWVSDRTSPNSRFLVITGDQFWGSDNTSEWFPALTGRKSVATIQGTEWLPHSAYARTIVAYGALQACAQHGSTCVSTWAPTDRCPEP